jgi:hypothetical protein
MILLYGLWQAIVTNLNFLLLALVNLKLRKKIFEHHNLNHSYWQFKHFHLSLKVMMNKIVLGLNMDLLKLWVAALPTKLWSQPEIRHKLGVIWWIFSALTYKFVTCFK